MSIIPSLASCIISSSFFIVTAVFAENTPSVSGLQDYRIQLQKIESMRAEAEQRGLLKEFDDLTLRAHELIKEIEVIDKINENSIFLLGECKGIIESLNATLRRSGTRKSRSFNAASPSINHTPTTKLQCVSSSNRHLHEPLPSDMQKNEDLELENEASGASAKSSKESSSSQHRFSSSHTKHDEDIPDSLQP